MYPGLSETVKIIERQIQGESWARAGERDTQMILIQMKGSSVMKKQGFFQDKRSYEVVTVFLMHF